MSHTDYAYWTSGKSLYAKPLPLDTGDWSGDVITGVENGSTGQYAFAALSESVDYFVYEQSGVSPASSDSYLGTLTAPSTQGGTTPTTLLSTTIATLASQTSFTLTDGSPDDNAYPVGSLVIVTDSATAEQIAVGEVSSYTASTKTLALAADPGIFTMAVGDSVAIVAATAGDATEAKQDTILAVLAGDGTLSSVPYVGTVDSQEVHQSYTWDLTLLNVGDTTGVEEVYFYLREREEQTDANALAILKLSIPADPGDGLIQLRDEPTPDATKAAITLDDAGDGNFTVTLSSEITGVALLRETLYYDIAYVTSTTRRRKARGKLKVTA